MSKHETSNQFKDGLIMDVHPLQTPNTALTDCLNGTFITYNGNEHVLQNDMGNFKLNKCKLKENYMPIGTVSYGDILYIASYNPIEKTFELGSYPSPLFWGAADDERKKTLTSVIEEYKNWLDKNQNNLENQEEKNTARFNWLNLSGHAQNIIFDDSAFKLCPGDKYVLKEEGEYDYRMESTNYYILDENHVKHQIFPQKGNDPVAVDWETPGYLQIEKTVMTPFEHKVSLKKAIIGNNSASFNIQSILTIQDENLCNIVDDIVEDFTFEIVTNIAGNSFIVSPKFIEETEENTTYIKCESQVSPWLGEKKQIISEYTITVNYPNDTPLWSEIDNEIIYNSVETILTIIPTVTDRDVTIIFDNLQQSLTYTANGNNVSSAATQYFTWERYEDPELGYKWRICFDQFYASDDDTITCRYGDIYNQNGYVEAITKNGDFTFDIDEEWSDQLLYVVITITPERGTPRQIGRFAFLDTSGVIKYTAYTRMDLLYNIQDVYDKICSKYKYDSATASKFTTNGKLTFNKPEFNISNLNGASIWFDSRIDDEYVECSQNWTFELKVNDIRINGMLSQPSAGIWKDLLSEYRLSSDIKNYIPIQSCQHTEKKQYSIVSRDIENPCAYVQGSLNKIAWNRKELAWDQDGNYDAVMCIHNLDSGTKREYTEYFDCDAEDKGTNYALWGTWWKNATNWMFNSIYAYKPHTSGDNYGITNIGYIDSKGRNGIDGYHIFGCVYGSKSVPEIIMTKDVNIQDTLYKFTPSDKTIKTWKNKYIYNLEEKPNSQVAIDPKIFISTAWSAGNNQTLRWIFSDSPNKFDIFAGVELDPMSKMTTVKQKFTSFEQINVDIPQQKMADITWSSIYNSVASDINSKQSLYKKMTSLCSNFDNMISVNCLHWGSDTISSVFPQCCVYNTSNGKVSFDKDLARTMGLQFSTCDAYFQDHYKGRVRTNLGPLKIVKYGF